jgi:hypothetical protein
MIIRRISAFGLTLAAAGTLMAGLAATANAQTVGTSSASAQFSPSKSPPAKRYLIVNAAHNLCLDAVSRGVRRNGDPIQLWNCNYGFNQQWVVANVNSAPNAIVNLAAGLCLDDDMQNFHKVQLWKCNGGQNQLWAATMDNSPPPPDLPLGNWLFHGCLDAVAKHDGSNGDKVWLSSDCTNQNNQNWTFESINS